MKRSNACTKPKGKTLKDLESSTKKLFNNFDCVFLSEKSGVKYTSVCSQKVRMKISQESATLYCKIKEVKAAGFTREMLRPDVKNWFDRVVK